MKTLRMLSALVALSLVLVPVAQAADIGVFFAGDATETVKEVRPFETFNIYVIMTNVNDYVNAVEYKLTLPATVIIDDDVFYGERSLNLGNSFYGVALGIGECVTLFDALPGQEMMVVETLTCRSIAEMAATDITLTKFLGGEEADQVSNPRYSDCDGTLYEMMPTSATLTTAVANSDASWGAVKALFN